MNLRIQYGIEPETIDEIQISEGLLELTPYLRHFFKECIYLLRIGGKLKIRYKTTANFYAFTQVIRPYSFLMYEQAICSDGFLELTHIDRQIGYVNLEFKKTKPFLAAEDKIGRWTFGIISNGSEKSIQQVKTIIEQIQKQKIPEYQLIICGPSSLKSIFHTPIEIISDDDLSGRLRAPITIKKNRIIQQAMYENILIQHDRIRFSDNWFHSFQQHEGNYYEVLCPQILDDETRRYSMSDWADIPVDLNNFKHAIAISHQDSYWSPYIVINGGLIIAKKRVLLANLLDERLSWGEYEDVVFSYDLYRNGFLIKPNFKIKNYSTTSNIKGHSWFRKKTGEFFWPLVKWKEFS